MATYDRLLEYLLGEKESRLSAMAAALSLDALTPCILGEYLNFAPPSARVLASGKVAVVRDGRPYLSSGVYLNSISEVDPFQIPEASIVQLRLFCQAMLRESGAPVLSTLETSILQHLLEYCHLDVTTSTNGGYFERLARLRDVLVREFHAYRGTQNLTLAHLIGIRAKPGREWHKFIPAAPVTEEHFLWKKSDDVDPEHERVEIHRGPYEIRLLTQHVTPRQPLRFHGIATAQPCAACIAADELHSQPGWDHLFVDSIQRPNSDGWEPHVLATETRMSAPEAGTLELTRAEIGGKVVSLSKQLAAECKTVKANSHSEQLGGAVCCRCGACVVCCLHVVAAASSEISQAHVFYSHRQVASEVFIPSAEYPKPFPRTIIFGREGVVKLFGPTLSKRHVFYRDLTEDLRRRDFPLSKPARSFITRALRLLLK